jgi:hypothetical protein
MAIKQFEPFILSVLQQPLTLFNLLYSQDAVFAIQYSDSFALQVILILE